MRTCIYIPNERQWMAVEFETPRTTTLGRKARSQCTDIGRLNGACRTLSFVQVTDGPGRD